MQESIQLVIESLPYLLKGAVFTLQLSIGGMFFGLLLGFVLALMRMSPLWPVRWLARFYISIFRGYAAYRPVIYDLLRPAAIWD
ncbi:amino acid ABC transporter permease [Salmonella enterica subsp. enterica serovar Newport str. VA_R100512572]|nr:amino acid ABC transporter permease [Salmonella enterica subsp. enterica serovar Newport str. VA_R100512572]